jgi:hypothetical protein
VDTIGQDACRFTGHAALVGCCLRVAPAFRLARPMSTKQSIRLLFVEIVPIDRFHRALAFPFLNALAKGIGADARWVRFGVRADARAGDKRGVDVPFQDRSTLLAAAAGCTHVLFGHQPCEALLGAIAAAAPAAQVGVAESGLFGGGTHGFQVIPERRGALLAFLSLDSSGGEPAEEETLFGGAADFGWNPANAAARDAPGLPFVLAGPECSYARPLARNPRWAGFSGIDAERERACSFCRRPPPGSFAAHPEEVLRRQFAAIERTHPRLLPRLWVRCSGEPAFLHLDTLSAILRAWKREPLDVLLDARADVIVRLAPKLESLLRDLSAARAPHRLHMSLVGIESFVDTELDLLNKGLTWRENLEALRILLDLEVRYVQSFGFRQHGGASLILFTPWTTLHDLAHNLAVVSAAAIEPLCGKLLTAKLRLYPDLPLAALAESAGLLTDAYGDARLDTAKANFYPDELPWRFADPRLESVCGSLLRLADSDCTPETSDVAGRGNADRLGIAQRIVDEALALPEPLDMAALARAAARSHDAKGEAGPDRPAGVLAATASVRHTDPNLLAAAAGIKPVVRLEHVRPEIEKAALRLGLAIAHYENKTSHGVPTQELLAGRNRSDLEEMLSVMARLDRPEIGAAEAAPLRIEAGRLLGYPRCCSERFARLPYQRMQYRWQRVAGRLAHSGPVAPCFNPAGPMNWIPCSLGCAASERLALAYIDAVADEPEAYLCRLRDPVLLLMHADERVLKVRLDGDPRQGRCGVRAGECPFPDPLFSLVAQADTMVLDDHRLWFERLGRPVVSLGARAFVWWHEAVLQPDFWSSILALRFRETLDESEEPLSAGPATAQSAVERLFVDQIRSSVGGRVFDGYCVLSVTRIRVSEVEIVLGSGTERLEILVSPRSPGRQGILQVGGIVASHPHGKPFDTAAKQRAARTFTNFLARALRDADARSGRLS